MADMTALFVLRADASQAKRELAAAGIAVKDMGAASGQAARGIDSQAEASERSAKAIAEQNRAAEASIGSMTRMTRVATMLGSAIGAALASGALGRAADNWSDLQSRIGSAIRDMDAAPAMMQRMLQIANDSYSPLAQTVEIFALNTTTLQAMGRSAQDAADFTEALNHSLVINATKGQDATLVTDALSRAISNGKLDTQGFQAIMSRSPRVLQSVADAMGVNINSLRQMASEGRVTGRVMVDAIVGSLAQVRAEAAEMPSTMSDGFLKIGNSLTALIGSVDQALGASGGIAEYLDSIAMGIGALAASDFSGLLDGMTAAATTLGQVLLVLAAARIPALITAKGALNIRTAATTALLAAETRANLALSAAWRGLGATLAFMGGPLGLVAAGVAALGLHLWNNRQAALAARQGVDDYDASLRGLAGAAALTEEAIKSMSMAQLLASRERAMEDTRQSYLRMIEEAETFYRRLMVNMNPEDMAFAQRLREITMAYREQQISLAQYKTALSELAEAAQNAEDVLALGGIADLADGMQASAASISRAEAAMRVFNGTATEADRALLDLGTNDGPAALAGNLSAATREAAALTGQLDAAMSAISALASANVAGAVRTAGLRAEVMALQAGASAADAAVDRTLAEARTRLAPALGSADMGVRMAAEQELARTEAQTREDAALNTTVQALRQDSTGGRTGGGRTSEVERERQAVTDLLAEQRRQIAALRETDPIQREILANHEALAAAIPAETAELRGLIAERQRLESIRDITDDIGAAGKDAFTGLLKGAHSLSDALISVLDKLADIAASTVWDMFWNGTGGSSGLSGIVSSLVGGLLPGGGGSGPTLQKAIARADGGPIHGPGGPRDDQVLMWGSNGEFVINAAATAANRGLVEAINAGASPSELLGVMIGRNMQRLATGGMVGAAPSAPRAVLQAAAPAAAVAFGPPPAPVINIINRSPEPIREERGSGSGPDLEGAVTLVVGKAEARGKFDKTRRARFGQTPEVARR